jgi:ATP-binding protein involved in chromosome partitioning
MSRGPTNVPRQIKRAGTSGLLISWADSSESQLSSEILRRQCPCAECRERRGDTSHAKPLIGKKRSLSIVQNTLEEQLGLETIWGVGQYAIGIRWSDGHDSGIYTFELLAELAGR